MHENDTNLDQQRERHIARFTRYFAKVVEQLQDPATEDVVLNPNGQLWVQKKGTGFSHIAQMSESTVLSAFATMAALRDTVITFNSPILETELPDGSRFEALRPPIVSAPTFAVRCRPRKIFTVDDYVTSGILTHKNDPVNGRNHRDTFLEQSFNLNHAEIIRLAVKLRKNILIVGATHSGKTTFANAILDEIAKTCPADRVILIEDTPELQCAVANYVALNAVGNITMADCLRVRAGTGGRAIPIRSDRTA